MTNTTCSPGNNYVLNNAGFITINSGWFGPTIFSLPIELDLTPVIIKQAKVKRGNAEGFECTACQDFYPMAELNQPDEAKECLTFKCYSCRKGLSTIFEEK